MLIRKANLADAKVILQLEKAWIKEGISWGLKQTEEKELIKSLKEEIWYLAENKGKIIAYVNSEIILSSRHMTSLDVQKGQSFGDLKSIYVLKKFRSKGLGSKLVQKAIKDMKKQKVKIIRLRAVSKDLLGLINYYHKFGFKERTANMVLKI